MALATISDLKAYLSISHLDDDTLLTRLVDAASKYFESQVGRTISSTSYTEVRNGDGSQTIVPSNYPVTAVSSLKLDGTAVTVSSAYGTDGYYIDGSVIRLRGYWTTTGQGNVELAYTAGYTTVPADIVEAVLEMAALMYREKDRVGQQSKNTADGSVVFYYTPPARVVATIEAYRRVA